MRKVGDRIVSEHRLIESVLFIEDCEEVCSDNDWLASDWYVWYFCGYSRDREIVRRKFGGKRLIKR